MTSEDLRTVTPHAGHTRRFRIYEMGPYDQLLELEIRELPQELVLAFWDGEGSHPLDDVDVLIAGSLGRPLIERMAQRGILAVSTTRKDPVQAVRAFFEAGGIEAFAERTVPGTKPSTF